MSSTALTLTSRHLGLETQEAIKRYGAAFEDLPSERHIARRRQNLISKIKIAPSQAPLHFGVKGSPLLRKCAFPLCLGLVALLTTPCWDNTLLKNTYIQASNKTVWIRGVYRGKVIRVG